MNELSWQAEGRSEICAKGRLEFSAASHEQGEQCERSSCNESAGCPESTAFQSVPGSRRFFLMLSAAIVLLIRSDYAAAQESTVLVPGHHRFASGWAPEEAGRLLISELNCQSCHGTFDGLVIPPRTAPILTQAGQRISPDFIQKLLENPQGAKPGTAMPMIHGAADPATRKAIAAFLTAGSVYRPSAVGVDAVNRGEVLFHRVGCAACHGDFRDANTIRQLRRGLTPVDPDDEEEEPEVKDEEEWKAPDFVVPLPKLEMKYTLSSLIDFLRNPHSVRPSGRMPSLNLTPEEARDIASWLLKDVQVEPNIRFDYYEGEWTTLPDFQTLKPSLTGRTTDFSTGVTERRDSFGLRFSGFLHVPVDAEYRFFLSSDDGARLKIEDTTVVDNDGVHPAGFRDGTIRLKAGVHELVVEYFEAHGEESIALELEGGGLSRQPVAGLMTLTPEPPKPETNSEPVDESLVATGREAFVRLGCAACHEHAPGGERLKWNGQAPMFAGMRTDRGCLADQPGTSVPKFALTASQRDQLRAAIRTPAAGASKDARSELRMAMTALNCFACHTRDMLSADASLNHVFAGTIPEMGDEGRIPPALDGAGDKLNETWLRTLLNEGAKDRPYMATRMPRFGAEQGNPIVDRMIALDRVADEAPVMLTSPEHRIKADARTLAGDKGLSCIKCHIFDRHAATGIQSLDMTRMTKRLRRDWFVRYLLDPQQYRPGTRMPAAWPRELVAFPDLLEGTARSQIEGLWIYLSDGTQAKVPSGLQREAIELKPVDRPLIYRNFLEGLSPRGIAVGFSEKAHFAWDAEHLTPRLIWHGAFIDASKHWVDRGPGNQVPLGDHVMTLPSGPPIVELISLDKPWPDQNPRELGYRFRGYSLNPDGVPTFRSSWQTLEFTDTLTPYAATPDSGLQRVIAVTSTEPRTNLWLRIASSTSVTDAGGEFVLDGVRYTVTGADPVMRTINDRRELLVPLSLESGQTVTIRVTMVW